MILLDTNIVIELLKGNSKILSVIETIGANNVILSKVTILEMYVGALNKNELKIIKKYLDKFPKIEFSDKIIDKTIQLVYQYYLSNSLFINDAIIAATCIENNTPLYTLNLKDFKYIEELRLYN